MKREERKRKKDRERGAIKTKAHWDFPGGPVVKTLPSSAGVVGLIPGQGAKMPHASWPKRPKHKTEPILQQIQYRLKMAHMKKKS